MDLFSVAILIVLLWVVSLCAVLCASLCQSHLLSFWSSGEIVGKRNILLVIAHPDDESMFFTPTILHLVSRGHNLQVLCMSTGNVDGKGDLRKEEFYQACASLKVPLQKVKVLDHPDLQDGFEKAWNHHLLEKFVEEEITCQGIDLLITFDNYGVSGHPNHQDVHHGLCMLLCGNSQRNIEAWELVSTSLARKYSGPLDIWLSILSVLNHPRGQMYCLVNGHPHKSFLAMAQHRSQWVWWCRESYSQCSVRYQSELNKPLRWEWLSATSKSLRFFSVKQVPEVVCIVIQLHLREHTQENHKLAVCKLSRLQHGVQQKSTVNVLLEEHK